MVLASAVATVLISLLVLLGVFFGLLGLVFLVQWLRLRHQQRLLDRAPDKVTLRAAPQAAWRDKDLMDNLVAPFTGRGFADLGHYQIDELHGVDIRLLVNTNESMLVAVWEQDRTRHWVEVASYYEDGGTMRYSTSTVPLINRPNHVGVNVAGTTPGAMYTRFKQERRQAALKPVTAETAVSLFQDAYVDEASWRREHGELPAAFAHSSHTPQGVQPAPKRPPS